MSRRFIVSYSTVICGIYVVKQQTVLLGKYQYRNLVFIRLNVSPTELRKSL